MLVVEEVSFFLREKHQSVDLRPLRLAQVALQRIALARKDDAVAGVGVSLHWR